MRAFPVSLPSGQRYWTVLGDDLQVVGVADGFLEFVQFSVAHPRQRTNPG
jgi:hypothetical protein